LSNIEAIIIPSIKLLKEALKKADGGMAYTENSFGGKIFHQTRYEGKN